MDFSKLEDNEFFNLNALKAHISYLEERIAILEETLETSLRIQRCHMVRIKNKEMLSDEYILNGHEYYDLSPEQAYQIYQNPNYDFILIDVSKKDFTPPHNMPEALKMPLEELSIRHKELVNKAVTILIISEDGIRSIKACEILNAKGFYNVNNISGGHKFWPASRMKMVTEESKNAA